MPSKLFWLMLASYVMGSIFDPLKGHWYIALLGGMLIGALSFFADRWVKRS